jgi:hypothetical protein
MHFILPDLEHWLSFIPNLHLPCWTASSSTTPLLHVHFISSRKDILFPKATVGCKVECLVPRMMKLQPGIFSSETSVKRATWGSSGCKGFWQAKLWCQTLTSCPFKHQVSRYPIVLCRCLHYHLHHHYWKLHKNFLLQITSNFFWDRSKHLQKLFLR